MDKTKIGPRPARYHASREPVLHITFSQGIARGGCISRAGKQPFQPFFAVRSGVLTRGVQRQNAEKCRKYGLSEGVQKY